VAPALEFLDGAERDSYLELERRWRYPTRESGRHATYQHELMASAWGRRAWRVAALRDRRGGLGAAASLHDLHWRLGARRLRLAGISSLAVAGRFRGLGLGRRLLAAVHDHLRGDRYDGALAFSTIGAGYFRRLGYEPLPLAVLEADLEGWRSSGPQVETRSRLRPYEPRDFEAVRNLYNTTSSLQELAVLRDEAYWDFVLRRGELAERMFPGERSVFLVGERDERVVSYMRASVRARTGRLVVDEYAVEPGAAEDMTALSRAVLERLGTRGRGPRRLRCVVPSRFRNWCPSRRMAWREEKRNVLMMLPLSGFAVPAESSQDERMIWSADRF
jgi:GNAT superfamily N-acetyltransferase